MLINKYSKFEANPLKTGRITTNHCTNHLIPFFMPQHSKQWLLCLLLNNYIRSCMVSYTWHTSNKHVYVCACIMLAKEAIFMSFSTAPVATRSLIPTERFPPSWTCGWWQAQWTAAWGCALCCMWKSYVLLHFRIKTGIAIVAHLSAQFYKALIMMNSLNVQFHCSYSQFWTMKKQKKTPQNPQFLLIRYVFQLLHISLMRVH